MFKYRTQSARTGFAFYRALGDGTQCVVAKFEHAGFHLEQLAVLFGQCILGLGQDLDQLFLIQFIKHRKHRQSTHEFRYQSVADQILGLDLMQELTCGLLVVLTLDLGGEADAALLGAVADDLVEASKCTATDEQDVRGIDLQEFLLGMLTAALRRHRRDRAFNKLEERLLNALARHVPRD